MKATIERQPTVLEAYSELHDIIAVIRCSQTEKELRENLQKETFEHLRYVFAKHIFECVKTERNTNGICKILIMQTLVLIVSLVVCVIAFRENLKDLKKK